MENLRSKLVTLIIFVFLLALVGWFVDKRFISSPTLITVVGEGRVTVKPELVKFTIVLVNNGVSATGVIADNKRLTQNIVLVLHNAGVQDQDINLAYARVVPVTVGTGQQFQAVNSLDVTLRKIGEFDNLFNQLYSAGVQSITNIVFTTENSRDLEKQAVTKAIKDAEQRVNEIAKVQKKWVGRMVSIATGEVGEAGALTGKNSSQAGVFGQTQASPSQIEIARQVSIIFELK